MKKNLFSLILLLSFTVFHTQAQNSLLWKITGKGIKHPSYLFGTFHLICEKDFIWTPAMQQAFNQTKQLCFEVPFDENLQGELMKYSVLKDSQHLKDFFTPAQYEKLGNYLKDSMGIPITAFDKMKPFNIMSLLILKSADCGFNIKAYEMEIAGMNKEPKRPVVGLETVAEQMAIVDKLPSDSIASTIMKMISDPLKSKADFNKMIILYKAQDIKSMHDLTKTDDAISMGFSPTVFVDDRNKAWIPKIIDMAAQTPTFFAVGAGHLGGQNGVINLLIKQGYTVQAVTK